MESDHVTILVDDAAEIEGYQGEMREGIEEYNREG